MASSPSKGVTTPLRIAHALESYQFLELPDDLLSLIESGSTEPLQLKSAPSNVSSELPAATTAPVAVVCSGNRTWEVRQAQSSNSLYVLEPATQSLMAIAQCKAALELTPVQPAATAFLGRALPVYRGPDAAEPVSASAAEALSREALLADVPFSASEFDRAWRAIGAFELEAQAVRPAADVQLSMWRSLTTIADVQGVKITRDFQLVDIRLLLEDEGFPSTLLEALMMAMGAETGASGVCRIEGEKCLRWLGITMIRSAGAAGIEEVELLQKWMELVPDQWKDLVRMDVLVAGDFKKQGSRWMLADDALFDLPGSCQQMESLRPKPLNKWHSRFGH